ncbi:hypothetical protein BGZ65_005977 [Modicella reniformis]|uniref:Uncharacterized protein n=1 Tax=Modicella reniformis TaxID=1440133 RepID=A0A9P6SQ71_9FUNG|nr:hypothetical protein BGZ65_005977 [Modicella reniformis]
MALAYISTCLADVWITGPIADTHWKIGAPAEVRWRLTSSTARQEVATVYLVGGDPMAYKRLETLGKDVVLGGHKLVIPKVPNVECGSSCAIEFWVNEKSGKGDYYSHCFNISITGAVAPTSITGDTGDKSTLVGGTSTTQNNVTTSDPITAVQSSTASSAKSIIGKGTMALLMTTVPGAAAVAMSLFL